MPSPLYDEVLDRLVRELDEVGEFAALVDAAMEGESALDAATKASGPWVRRAGAHEPTTLRGVWLQRLTVEGFRGIGPKVILDLEPRPGLVLVCGRNGTGKSSLAEGFEALLTGRAARVEKRSAEWRTGWRNLGHARCEVSATFAAEGLGPFEVKRVWPSEATTIEDGVETATAGRAALAVDWASAVASYRPLLGTQELARMHDDGPSARYDALKGILGLEELTAAAERLGQRKRAAKLVADGGKSPKDLVDKADSTDDARAAPLAALLRKKTPDLDAVEQLLAAADTEEASGLPDLRRRASAPVPDVAAALAAAQALDDARAARSRSAGSAAERARATAALLDAALAWHTGPGDCPVCATPGAIDAGWRARVASARAALAAEAAEVEALDGAVRAAEAALRPYVVDDVPREAWAAHVRDTLPGRAAAVLAARDAASAELARRERAWGPVAVEARAWLHRAREAAEARIAQGRFHDAEAWVRKVEEELRAARFAPIAAQTKAIWATLRQSSAVELTEVGLAGVSKQRRVELKVAVDGQDHVALGVMSQGELNALALALFLPRAALDASPFRFVVVDDPVQAMDPGKVDGLARTLAGFAQRRQVVVLTHDPRLAEAVRRLQLPARVLEVTRQPGSKVHLQEVVGPVRQALRDACDVLEAKGLSDVLRRTVIPGFCRQAVEAACVAVVSRRRLGRGDPATEVEDALSRAHKLVARLALALFDDAERGNDVSGALPKGTYSVIKALNAGAHGHYDGDLAELVDAATHVARYVEDRR